MNTYPSLVLHREIVAHETLACVIARPAGFTFRAGQYVDVTLSAPRYEDALGPTRSMSVASAPSERDLLLLMRQGESAFKRSLAEMPLGSRIRLEAPADDLNLDMSDTRPSVLLAGGVGIAPFLSALREAAYTRRSLDTTLFYSNRRPEDAAYLQELSGLTTRIPGCRCIPVMTQVAKSAQPWSGETERLGVSLLARSIPALAGPRYFLSGSTGFISGLCQEIERAGVPPRDIRIEMYTGY